MDLITLVISALLLCHIGVSAQTTGTEESSGSGDPDFMGFDNETTTDTPPTPPTTANITTSSTDITTNATTPPTTTTASTPTSPATTTPATTTTATRPPISSTSPTSPTSPTSSTSPTSTENIVGVAVGVSLLGVIMILLLIIFVVLCCYIHQRGGMTKMFSLRGEPGNQEVALTEYSNGKAAAGTQEPFDTTKLFEHIEPSELVTVPCSDLASHVTSLHLENGSAAEEEYDEVKEMDQAASIICASESCNEPKNRYINILPRDETRVVLQYIPKVPGSDYINANYVDGYNSSKEYIASQGPLPNTVCDFWRMIWEQESTIIVMVTNPLENGVTKCEEYWPPKAAIKYGNILVSLETQHLFPEFIIRHFIVKNVAKKAKKDEEDEGRKIIQFHFTSWPDFGVPQDSSSMLKFVRHIRQHVTSLKGPMVVHCSAGVGRTGTFIAIDILLQKIKDAGPGGMVNVQEIVCRMRAQRGNMVQTSAQYLFIYDSSLHAFTHGSTEVSIPSLKDYTASLATPLPGSDESQWDKEFGHVMSIKLPTEFISAVAMEDINESKNRVKHSLPFDHNRVSLEEMDCKEEDNDYINASFINGYYNRVEFISTQHPLPTTRDDFWRMVIERSSSTIVVFGPLKDPEDRYWPEGTEKYEFEGGLVVYREEEEEEEEGEQGEGEEKKGDEGVTGEEVKVGEEEKASKEEAEDKGKSKKSLVIRNIGVEMDETKLSVTIFHLEGWPAEGVPSSGVPLLQLVEQSRKLWRETGFNPIIIHTATGVEQEVGGVYCGVCILLRQREVEDAIDVVTTMERIRLQRPSIFASKDQYRYIYEVLTESLS